MTIMWYKEFWKQQQPHYDCGENWRARYGFHVVNVAMFDVLCSEDSPQTESLECKLLTYSSFTRQFQNALMCYWVNPVKTPNYNKLFVYLLQMYCI